MNTETPSTTSAAGREENAIYQNNRIVARVTGAETDAAGKEIHFAEVHNSDRLVLADECEFQKYKIIVKRVDYASKVTKEEPQKGRILRGVAAEILAYREQ